MTSPGQASTSYLVPEIALALASEARLARGGPVTVPVPTWAFA
jgi:hypothetical protein